MGTMDQCIFCKTDLEEYNYGHLEENGERAEDPNDNWNQIDICKDCIKKLKILLGLEKGEKK